MWEEPAHSHLLAWCWTESPREWRSSPGACGQHRGWWPAWRPGCPGSWWPDLPLTSLTIPGRLVLLVKVVSSVKDDYEAREKLPCGSTWCEHTKTCQGTQTSKQHVERSALIGWQQGASQHVEVVVLPDLQAALSITDDSAILPCSQCKTRTEHKKKQ